MSKIFIDSGHGGRDPGATSKGIKEKDITLDVGLLLGQMLEKKGFKVAYTRTNDSFVSLSDRASKSNRFGSDIFISIHCNAFTSPKAKGVETFYYYKTTKKGQQLASRFQNSIVQNNLSTANRGIKKGNFYVLRRTKATAVLLELGFITNDMDRKILLNKKKEFAEAIFKGLKEYLWID